MYIIPFNWISFSVEEEEWRGTYEGCCSYDCYSFRFRGEGLMGAVVVLEDAEGEWKSCSLSKQQSFRDLMGSQTPHECFDDETSS
jgi:hypothetical protein